MSGKWVKHGLDLVSLDEFVNDPFHGSSGVDHVNHNVSLKDSVVEWNPFFEVVLTSSNSHDHVSCLQDARDLHGSDEVKFVADEDDWNSNVLLFDQLSNFLVEFVVLLCLELDWSIVSEKLITLSFDLLSVKFFLSSKSLLFLSDDLLVLFDLSSEAIEFSFSFVNDLLSVKFVLSFELFQSLLESLLLSLHFSNDSSVLFTLKS